MSQFNEPAQYDRLRQSSQEHVRRYRETDGKDGQARNGRNHLLLTTTGRRSGAERTTPLIYGQDGDRYIVVASVGGADRHPDWYSNLVQQPRVQVQVGAERFTATARTASAEEKPALWTLMTGLFPPYLDYQRKTSRNIPVVILERS